MREGMGHQGYDRSARNGVPPGHRSAVGARRTSRCKRGWPMAVSGPSGTIRKQVVRFLYRPLHVRALAMAVRDASSGLLCTLFRIGTETAIGIPSLIDVDRLILSNPAFPSSQARRHCGPAVQLRFAPPGLPWLSFRGSALVALLRLSASRGFTDNPDIGNEGAWQHRSPCARKRPPPIARRPPFDRVVQVIREPFLDVEYLVPGCRVPSNPTATAISMVPTSAVAALTSAVGGPAFSEPAPSGPGPSRAAASVAVPRRRGRGRSPPGPCARPRRTRPLR